jgi:large subunit ribosomal protein L23
MQREHVLKRPILLTEKATRLREGENKVVFEVDKDANKIEIKDAVEKLFNVEVASVNTLVTRGHMKRMGRGYARLRNKKKAVVTLKEGHAIQFFDEEKAAG